MKYELIAAAAVQLLCLPTVAQAQDMTTSDAPQQEAEQQPATTGAVGFSDRFVLDTGRTEASIPDNGLMRLQVHGEYQLRYGVHTDPPLQPTLSEPNGASLGQRASLRHWLRLRPRVDAGSWFSLVAQLDAPFGFFLGQRTHGVEAAARPMRDYHPMRAELREMYLQAMTPIGLFRLGQQASHWGTGLLVNDGDHPTLFGDYQQGDLVERLLFATKPLGKQSPWAVILAGDLVRRDIQANLDRDDIAWQGTLGTLLGEHENQVGLAGIMRRQHRDATSIGSFSPYTENLNVWIVDGFGKFAVPLIPEKVFLFGEGEAAFITGSTNYVRTPELATHHIDEQVTTWGGMAKLGVVSVTQQGAARWGRFVGAVEWGYATGDADPNDGEQKRFNFQPNHKVGLVLFDQVLAWETARSATAAADPLLVQRATPGLQFYPSNGGVFGATYINPTLVYRPRPWLDLKTGMVLARSTADRVDPYRFGALGQIANAQGGKPDSRDLGMELDAGLDTRVKLKHEITLQVGFEAGILFPGHALDDAAGSSYPTQGMVMSKGGLQF